MHDDDIHIPWPTPSRRLSCDEERVRQPAQFHDIVPLPPRQCNADACREGRMPCPVPQACERCEGTGRIASDVANVAGIAFAFLLDKVRNFRLRVGLAARCVLWVLFCGAVGAVALFVKG